MWKYLQHLPHQQNSHIYLKQFSKFSSSCHVITVGSGGAAPTAAAATTAATAVTLNQAQSESKCSHGHHLFT
jgi:hypothetical protein